MTENLQPSKGALVLVRSNLNDGLTPICLRTIRTFSNVLAFDTMTTLWPAFNKIRIDDILSRIPLGLDVFPKCRGIGQVFQRYIESKIFTILKCGRPVESASARPWPENALTTFGPIEGWHEAAAAMLAIYQGIAVIETISDLWLAW